MTKSVEVSVEVFGNKKINRVYNNNDLNGKSAGSVIEEILGGASTPEDRKTAQTIRDVMSSSGGYSVEIGRARRNEPVRFLPVDPHEPTTKHVDETNLPMEKVRYTVLGEHTVGRYY